MNINAIAQNAKDAAYKAADHFFNVNLGGEDRYPCGFAWVEIYDLNGKKIRANSKVGKALIEAGFTKQDWGGRAWQLWNPSKYGCQNVETLEAGAEAATRVFKEHGFSAYACSRLD